MAPCQHLDVRLPASGTVREYISVALSHPACENVYGAYYTLSFSRAAGVGASGPCCRSGIGGLGNHMGRSPQQHVVSLCSAVLYTGGSGGELEEIHRKEKLPDLIGWKAGERPSMMSCNAFVPKRNECSLGAGHRCKAEGQLRLTWTWLPLRNSQLSEGERYVTRHNEESSASTVQAKPTEAHASGTSCDPHRETP